MFTFKAEHKFSDNSSLSGMYIYNRTDEPGSTIMQAGQVGTWRIRISCSVRCAAARTWSR